MAFAPNNTKGFALIVVAVILAVAAILIVIILPNDSEKHHDEVTKTANKIKAITNAIVVTQGQDPNYALPCPAAFNQPTGSPTFGTSLGGPSTQTTPSAVGNSNCTCTVPGPTNGIYCPSSSVMIGSVPTKTLGLPDDDAFDEWGNRLTYVMAPAIGATLNVTDLNNNAIPGLQVLVISHGPDGMGAYNRSGSINSTCSTQGGSMSNTLSEYANCNFSSTTNFVKNNWHNTNQPNAAANTDLNFFDDIVGANYGCPGNVLGCTLWVDANDQGSLNTTTPNQQITLWKDKSGNGNNLSTTTAGPPTYAANSINANMPSLSFPGTFFTQQMKNYPQFTTFMLGAPDNTGQSRIVRVNMPPNQWGDGFGAFYISPDALDVVKDGVAWGYPSTSVPTSAPHLFNLNQTGSALNLDMDGLPISYYNTPASLGNSVWLGMSGSGKISEFALYPTLLSPQDQTKVTCYFGTKWGISVGGCTCPGGVIGCTGWYDASNINNTTSGSTLTLLKDKSGTGNDMVTIANAPIYNTTPATQLNGHNTITLNGVANNQALASISESGITGSAGRTIIGITQNLSGPGNSGVFSIGLAGNYYNVFTPFAYYTSSNSWYLCAWGDDTSNTTPPPPDLNWDIHDIYYTPPSGSLPIGLIGWRINGNNLANFPQAPSGGVPLNTSPNPIDLGIFQDFGWLNSNFAEMVFYPYNLSDADKKKVECYMQDKWYNHNCPNMGGVSAANYCNGIGAKNDSGVLTKMCSAPNP